MPQFKTVKSLKSFLIWCRDNNIMKIELADASFIFDPNLVAHAKAENAVNNAITFNDITDNPSQKEPTDEDLLYYSTNE